MQSNENVQPTPDLPESYSFSSLTSEELASAPSEILESSFYAGVDSRGYAIKKNGIPVSIAWYWFGDRYRNKRNFWPLKNQEAKLVHIVSEKNHRGHGLGSALIICSTDAMRGEGFESLFCRIWHSNTPSIRAFEKAGWRRVALVIEFQLRGFDRKFRIEKKL